MTYDYYMLQLNGWRDLVNRFNHNVMSDVWNKLVNGINNNELITSGDFSLLEKDVKTNSLIFRENPAVSGDQDSDRLLPSFLTFLREFLGVQAYLNVKVDIWKQSFSRPPSLGNDIELFALGKKLVCQVNNGDPLALELAEILREESTQSYLQPIVDLNSNKTVGYEMLTRGPQDSELFRADKLFAQAASLGVSDELEKLCLKKAVNLLPHIKDGQFITANIAPDLLKDESLLAYLTEHNTDAKLKLELTEHLPVEDWAALRENMQRYQQSTCEFWLDDAGCGYFGLETIQEVKPSVVKLCITLISRIECNQSLLEELKKVVEQVHAMGGKVLGEGVETKEQAAILKQIGVDLAQGYYYAKPANSAEVLGL